MPRDIYHVKVIYEVGHVAAIITGPGLKGSCATDGETRADLEALVRDIIIIYTDRDLRMPYDEAMKDFDLEWEEPSLLPPVRDEHDPEIDLG